jgi:hypothetical protein
MYIEGGGGSVGFFLEDESDDVLVGQALFACLRGYCGEPLLSAICQPEISAGYREAPTLREARPENLLQFLEGSGHSAWKLCFPEAGRDFRLYWDTCDRFMTVFAPESNPDGFDAIALAAITAWRGNSGEVRCSWDG